MMTDLNDAFLDYIFTESNHTYIHKPTNKSLISVTSLLKKLVPEFNENFWLAYKVLQRNGYNIKYENDLYFLVDGYKFNPTFDSLDQFELEFTPEDLKYEWYLTGKIGNTRGTFLHNYMENLWKRKIIQDEIPSIINSLDSVEAIKYIKSLEILKNLADSLYDDLITKYTFVTSEYVVGDVNLEIAGTFDLLLKNKNTGLYEIWDYKTDKKMRQSGNGEMIKGFNIPFSELNKYSLQLGIYKEIIERNTDIKIDKCNIVHFNYKKNSTEILEISDFSENIKNFFNGNNSSTYF